VATTVSLTDLMNDCLFLAKIVRSTPPPHSTRRQRAHPLLPASPAPPQEDIDVFNCLNLMENSEFLEKLRFGAGDGNLQYYL
jgi:hypothetical protein